MKGLQWSKILTGQELRHLHVGCTDVPSVGQDHWPLNYQGKKRCNCTLENAFFKEYERATEYSPRVNKVEDTQFLGEGSSQAVSIQDYVVMQESWICVQDVHLSCCSLCDGGVTMTHLEKHTYNMSVRALKRPATRWQKCNTLYFFNWLEKTDLRLDDNVLPCWTLLIQSK